MQCVAMRAHQQWCHRDEGVRRRPPHASLSVRVATVLLLLLLGRATSASATTSHDRRLGECTGQAVGGPGIQPSNPWDYVSSKPSRRSEGAPAFKFALAKHHVRDRKCRELDKDEERELLREDMHKLHNDDRRRSQPVAGLEPLFEFAKRVQLKPTCDFRKLRSWGGISIPADYCSGGSGPDGWTGFDVGGATPPSAVG
jgi:hypothetical protein